MPSPNSSAWPLFSLDLDSEFGGNLDPQKMTAVRTQIGKKDTKQYVGSIFFADWFWSQFHGGQRVSAVSIRDLLLRSSYVVLPSQVVKAARCFEQISHSEISHCRLLLRNILGLLLHSCRVW